MGFIEQRAKLIPGVSGSALELAPELSPAQACQVLSNGLVESADLRFGMGSAIFLSGASLEQGDALRWAWM